MSTKSSFYAPFSTSSLANFLAWGQGLSTALAAVGFTKVTDANSVFVNWANVIAANIGASAATRPVLGTFQYQGAFSGTTAYVGTISDSGTNDYVTSSGLTYMCIGNTSSVMTKAVQNTNQSLTLASVAASSAGVAVYTGTITGGGSNAFLGFVFVITGFVGSNNNGTFICTASAAGTLTLSNPAATIESAVANAASSTANEGFLGTFNTGVGATGGQGNAYVGQTWLTSGFTNSSNNNTITITASSATCIGAVNSGTTETHASAALNETAPASNYLNWAPYLFEIWQFNDTAQSTCPIYFKISYSNVSPAVLSPQLTVDIATGVVNSGSGTTYMSLSGNIFGGNGLRINNGQVASGTFYESDVYSDGSSLGLILFRTAITSFYLVIDRARTTTGSPLDAFFQICYSNSIPIVRAQVLFKPGFGGISPLDSANFPTICCSLTSQSANGEAPVLPIFPIGCGYMANPILAGVTMRSSDVNEGSLVSAVVGGTSHTYLFTKGVGSTQGGASTAVAIRWE